MLRIISKICDLFHVNTYFLYFWAHIRMIGAMRVIKNNVKRPSHITVRDREASKYTAEAAMNIVKESQTATSDVYILKSAHEWKKHSSMRTCSLCLSMGSSANAWTEKRASANTATSVQRRDAKTTDAETAAFIDNTEVNLGSLISS